MLAKSVVEKLEKSVGEECCREVLEKSVGEQLALIESSSSLHFEARNALGVFDGVIHSRIS